jgi:hypothetical protein
MKRSLNESAHFSLPSNEIHATGYLCASALLTFSSRIECSVEIRKEKSVKRSRVTENAVRER